jgi:Bcr/CflA subfamily drug resistance transporter
MDGIKKNIYSNHVLFFVFLLTIVGQSAVDLYLPSFPAIVASLNTTNTMVQFTLCIFIAAYAISQLVYGPLSDYFGRRPVLLFGLGIFSFASMMCALSVSISFLLIFRLLQGFGAGAVNLHQRVLIRDVFEGKALHRSAALVATTWALVPMIAPIIGGYIQESYNWRINFVFLAMTEIFLFILIAKKLPETNRKDRTSVLTFKKILIDYKSLWRLSYIGSVMTCAILNGIFITFNVAGPFLFQECLKLSPVQYGWILLLSGGSFLIGSYLSGHLTKIMKIYKIVILGFFCIMIGDLSLISFIFIKTFTVITFIFPMGIIFFGIGLIYSNCVANSIKNFPHIAGAAAAIFGFMISISGSIVGAVFSRVLILSPLGFAMTVFLLTVLSFSFYLLSLLKNVSNDYIEPPVAQLLEDFR